MFSLLIRNPDVLRMSELTADDEGLIGKIRKFNHRKLTAAR